MTTTKWEKFYKESVLKIFTEKKSIIDIGGGLRISQSRGNRYNEKLAKELKPFLDKVSYEIMDPVADYNPDIVGDIHNMPFPDESYDAVICLAVLEHIENPFRASREMHRILKKGGHCFVYVPFLYYYHAERGYYKDYWRFTKDSVEMLFKDFTHMEIQPVRGAIETWLHISPLGKIYFLRIISGLLDVLFRKTNSNQVSGYYIFLVK